MTDRAVCWLWLAAMLVLVAAGAYAGRDWPVGMAFTGAAGWLIGHKLR